MAESDTIQLRFRHTSGTDLGPFSFSDLSTVQQVKEKLVAEWPRDGTPLAKEPPTQVADIKLILSGKYVDNTKTLKEYRKDMGEVKPDSIITMHVIVRPTTVVNKQQGSTQGTVEKPPAKGCCIIS